MNNIDIMNFWIESSDDDYKTMLTLYKNKKYNWALFVGHVVIEKLLKALYAKNNKNAPHAPRSHDLTHLSSLINLSLTNEQKIMLDEITKFCLSARYDNYKKEFQLLCTKEYTTEKMKNIEEVRKWLKILLKDGKPEK